MHLTAKFDFVSALSCTYSLIKSKIELVKVIFISSARNRGSYNKIQQVDRDRLINCFNNDRDWISLAEELAIKRQTARSIIINYKNNGHRKPLQKGGNRPKSLTTEMVDFCVNVIEDKCTTTLNELRIKLLARYPNWRQCSTQTISNALNGKLITLKLCREVPVEWNTTRTKEQRCAYAQWMNNEGLQKQLVFIDEMGANIWTSRSQGRPLRGQRAVRIVQGQRGQNLTVCLAVSPIWGLVHKIFLRGGMKQEKFGEFLTELSTLLHDEQRVFIMDNARCHFNEPTLNDGHAIKKLPPYSPFLNMTERAISSVKASLKASLAESVILEELGNHNVSSRAPNSHFKTRIRKQFRKCHSDQLPTVE